jgi:hypothetical protein
MTSQIHSVGAMPTEVECFIGALMYGSVDEARAVLGYVLDDDLDHPARTVLSSIRTLCGRGVIPSPQLVSDDLRRRGKLTRSVAAWLATTATTGACASAARHYASACLATSFRRQVESFSAALPTAASTGSEVDVAHIAEQAATRIAATYARLQHLRGDADE